MFLALPGEAKSGEDADAFATAAIERFFREVWTFGPPKPAVYYDPGTAMQARSGRACTRSALWWTTRGR